MLGFSFADMAREFVEPTWAPQICPTYCPGTAHYDPMLLKCVVSCGNSCDPEKNVSLLECESQSPASPCEPGYYWNSVSDTCEPEKSSPVEFVMEDKGEAQVLSASLAPEKPKAQLIGWAAVAGLGLVALTGMFGGSQ